MFANWGAVNQCELLVLCLLLRGRLYLFLGGESFWGSVLKKKWMFMMLRLTPVSRLPSQKDLALNC